MAAFMVSVFLYPLALAAWKSELMLSSIPLVIWFSAQLTTLAQCLMVLATSTTFGILLWVGC